MNISRLLVPRNIMKANVVEKISHGTKGGRAAKERCCIISRRTGEAEEMIRFVADPQGLLIPDIKGNLPGRGAWVFASSVLVKEAVRRRAFAHVLKKPVQIPPDLPGQVDKLLIHAALANLSLARRSGAIITGAEKVKAAIRAGHVALLLHAAEAAADGKRKLAQLVCAVDNAANLEKKGQAGIKTLSPFTAEELQLAFGRHNVIHIAVMKDRGAAGFIKAVLRLTAYRSVI